jgi:hypothetical protein
MKLVSYGKDGGKDSTVWGFWLIEIKCLFSLAVLVFENGSRDAYHSHAFNCISWVLRGQLREELRDGHVEDYLPGVWPIVTRRHTFHKVTSLGRTVVVTFRGPWANTWAEYIPKEDRAVVLTHGRSEVSNVSHGHRA